MLDEIAKSLPSILPDASGLSLLDDASKEKFFRSMARNTIPGAGLSTPPGPVSVAVPLNENHLRRRDLSRAGGRVLFVGAISGVLPISDLAANEKASPRTAAASVSEPAVTEIVASIGEVRVKSPVLGVVLLVISILFFYLYLVYVYPIHNVL